VDWTQYAPNPAAVYIVAVTEQNELVANRMPSGDVARRSIVAGNYDHSAGYKAVSIVPAAGRAEALQKARKLGRTWKNAR
jgi:hypothetical protein